jgi:two-component system, OmpR family, sensor histidine kinase BaeS
MMISLRRKLSSSYILLIIICVILISSLSNFFLNRHFRNYVIQQQEKKNKAIVEDINRQYTSNGKWNIDLINNIGLEAIEDGLFITIKDLSGNMVWDAETYNFDKCEIVKKQLTSNMISRYPKWEAMYTKDKYDVLNTSLKVGTIEIGYFGPFYYTDSDILYLNTLNRILIGVGSAALIIALILGLIMARGLSTPILKVIDTAEMISSGNYSKKIDSKTDIAEINKLILTVNNLGSSLYSQESLRKRLTRDVSHELRTPLTTLQSHMEAMIDGVWDPTIERLTSCQEEILRLKRLVGDLENLSEYESESLMLDKTTFDLGEVIKNIVYNFENEFINKGVKLIFNEKKINLFADKDKISQVIVNLLSNALKYTKEGGEVIVKLSEDKDYVIVSVKDKGIGISEKDLPFIFERFYRVDESRDKSTGGAGIGLAIAEAIVQAHGGTISVESKIGKGTEFIVKVLKE